MEHHELALWGVGPIGKGLRIDKRRLVPASAQPFFVLDIFSFSSSNLYSPYLLRVWQQSLFYLSAATAITKMRVLSLFALVAPLVSAIQFQEPFANSTLKKGETYSVKWSSVDTDPTVFSIFLVNFVDWPPFYTQVASDVPTSEGEHKVTVPCDVNSSWGFQL